MYLFHLHAVTPHYSVSRQLPSVKKVGLELFPQKQPETPHQHLIILNHRRSYLFTNDSLTLHAISVWPLFASS